MLRIHSIFLSIQGEVNNVGGQGTPTVFIRFAGCKVGCSWCDTVHNHDVNNGKEMPVCDILAAVCEVSKGCKSITITGGEPLEQIENRSFYCLLNQLSVLQYSISIETSGTVPISPILLRYESVSLVVDYKPKSSTAKISLEQLEQISNLRSPHIIKFPVMNKKDYEEAVTFIVINFGHVTSKRPGLFLSPVLGLKGKGVITPQQVFNRLKADSILIDLGVGLNLQIHKFIFDNNNEEETNGFMYGEV